MATNAINSTPKHFVKAKASDIERGATVWEPVEYSPGLVKHHEYKVISTNRGAALCETKDGKHHRRLIKYGDLMIEARPPEPEKPAAKPATTPPPSPASVRPISNARGAAPSAPPAAPPSRPSAPASPDDDVDAWLKLGANVLDSLRKEVSELDQAASKLESELDAIDKHHRAHIEDLEAQLQAAKREHQEDRALASTRREDVTKRLERRRERLELLERLQGLK